MRNSFSTTPLNSGQVDHPNSYHSSSPVVLSPETESLIHRSNSCLFRLNLPECRLLLGAHLLGRRIQPVCRGHSALRRLVRRLLRCVRCSVELTILRGILCLSCRWKFIEASSAPSCGRSSPNESDRKPFSR